MGIARIRHEDNGKCPKCQQILDRYPGFYEPMRDWFEGFQSKHPEAHISCAGRGYEDQETLFQGRRSNAHYGESAHNWNAALDIWENQGDRTIIYESLWFLDVLRPNLPAWIDWYGRVGAPFHEMPHVEPKNWKRLRDSGLLALVEPMPEDGER